MDLFIKDFGHSFLQFIFMSVSYIEIFGLDLFSFLFFCFKLYRIKFLKKTIIINCTQVIDDMRGTVEISKLYANLSWGLRGPEVETVSIHIVFRKAIFQLLNSYYLPMIDQNINFKIWKFLNPQFEEPCAAPFVELLLSSSTS